MRKLDKNDEIKVVGGTSNNVGGSLNSKFDPNQEDCVKRRERWKDDAIMKAVIRKKAEDFDSRLTHTMDIAECPGCGCLVNSRGNVCKECRDQSKS